MISGRADQECTTIAMPRDMRILHGAADTAWQASVLARQLRDEGYPSYSLAYHAPSWGEPPDRLIDTISVHGWRRAARQLSALCQTLSTFDLFHIHFGRSLLYNNLDVPLLRARGKIVVFHFHGSEVRLQSTERRIREWEIPTVPLPSRYFCWRLAWRVAVARRFGALTIVSTPDLLEVVPEAVHLPVALRLSAWQEEPTKRKDRRLLRVAHSPTDPSFKGTIHLQAAVERLQSEGLPIELDIMHNVPHHHVLERMRQADVFVDQLNWGWYGLAAVEAVALGTPTICYIRDDYAARASHMLPLPYIQADKHSIEDVLRDIYNNRDMLSERVAAGRRFVEEQHDACRVTQRLLALYTRALCA